jgi:hypothetical protein
MFCIPPHPYKTYQRPTRLDTGGTWDPNIIHIPLLLLFRDGDGDVEETICYLPPRDRYGSRVDEGRNYPICNPESRV